MYQLNNAREEQEAIIAIDYYSNECTVYTTKSSVANRLAKLSHELKEYRDSDTHEVCAVELKLSLEQVGLIAKKGLFGSISKAQI